MKKIILGVGLFVLGTNIFAQQDAKAKEILEQLSTKTKAHTSIYAEFDYNIKNTADGIDETQSGSLLSKGDTKYRLNIVGQEIINNGTTIWTFVGDACEVQINSAEELAEEEDNLMNPSTLFTIYEKGFKYKYIGQTTINGRTTEEIHLFPENANDKPYHTIKLFVDNTKKEIVKVIMKNKDGNTYTYIVKKFTPNAAAEDSKFNFNKSQTNCDEIEEIDLR